VSLQDRVNEVAKLGHNPKAGTRACAVLVFQTELQDRIGELEAFNIMLADEENWPAPALASALREEFKDDMFHLPSYRSIQHHRKVNGGCACPSKIS
jgi:hypothetical protein